MLSPGAQKPEKGLVKKNRMDAQGRWYPITKVRGMEVMQAKTYTAQSGLVSCTHNGKCYTFLSLPNSQGFLSSLPLYYTSILNAPPLSLLPLLPRPNSSLSSVIFLHFRIFSFPKYLIISSTAETRART